MTTYRIKRFDASTVECRVFEDDKISHELQHIPLHSPTGFNCGYAGSGPADLALSILVHYLGEDPFMVHETARNKIGNESKALRMHQRFKQDIMPLIQIGDGEHYNLTSEQIGLWLEDGLYSYP
jgi:hypothetical protein